MHDSPIYKFKHTVQECVYKWRQMETGLSLGSDKTKYCFFSFKR